MCGLSGLKPTWGRVSRAGVFPLANSLDHIGPMCRTALDCRHMLGVIAGADDDDPTAAPNPVPDYAAAIGAGVKGRRSASRATSATSMPMPQRALEGAVEALRKAGATIVDVALPSDFDGGGNWPPLCAVETAFAHEKTYPARANDYGPGSRP